LTSSPSTAPGGRAWPVVSVPAPFSARHWGLFAGGMRFRGRALVTLGCAVIGAVTALSLAWLGYGVWALVLAPISMFVCRAIGLTAAAKLLVRPVFDFRGALAVIGFGWALALCQSV